MTTSYEDLLRDALDHSLAWLESLPDRPVPALADVATSAKALGGPLPEEPTDPREVIAQLATGAEPGLTAMGSGRFFGFVIGGTLPVALAADWLTSAWDQNAGSRLATPAATAAEDAVGAWVLDLLDLPAHSAVGLATGATMANTTGLAAARGEVLRRAGWDLDRDGLFGAPRISVVVGAERHDTIDLGLRYLGLGAPVEVAVDDQGRIRPDALGEELARRDGPVIVVLQAGNLHSGAFDPFEPCIAVAHEHGAWVHVDGAFGLWAAAAPARRHLTAGVGAADSWGTDAHKTLNTPYDCGLAIVADAAAVRAAMGVHAAYLPALGEQLEPYDKVPELSRRARSFAVWAALRALGRRGVGDLVEGLCRRAAQMATGLAAIPGVTVLNDVDYTQVCFALADDAATERAGAALMADGTTWITGSRWRGRAVLRVSVSGWRTTEDDVATSLGAVRRATAAAR